MAGAGAIQITDSVAQIGLLSLGAGPAMAGTQSYLAMAQAQGVLYANMVANQASQAQIGNAVAAKCASRLLRLDRPSTIRPREKLGGEWRPPATATAPNPNDGQTVPPVPTPPTTPFVGTVDYATAPTAPAAPAPPPFAEPEGAARGMRPPPVAGAGGAPVLAAAPPLPPGHREHHTTTLNLHHIQQVDLNDEYWFCRPPVVT